MKNWLICIDDTDDIGTKGTGEIAEEIAQMLADVSGGKASFITRHQLFVHPDIPYTSHNSAMCFHLCSPLPQDEILKLAVAHLVAESAPAADPGIAILDTGSVFDASALIDFGRKAKSEVITKAMAYALAEQQNISLTEHGGTGQGIIGALAGLGLRLLGNDGRVKGKIKLGQSDEVPHELSVADILAKTGLDAVMSTDEYQLKFDEMVQLKGKVKAVYLNHKFVLLVNRDANVWCNASKQVLQHY
ncbi:DNA-binding protein [Shewanella sp. MEBiC00475]|uniref:DNA-binding protein n=1 Tax=Shewanella sp. MEBiC00475 TaxID=2575361 RepID=UPI0010BFFFC0|nr:DNA-binding protein [Shewanella sp. MEBiC00475]